jgi:hypothetical protein
MSRESWRIVLRTSALRATGLSCDPQAPKGRDIPAQGNALG